MYTTPESELETRWLDLQPESGRRILARARWEDRNYTVPLLLGLKGPNSHGAAGALTLVMITALRSGRVPELPTYSVDDADGNPTNARTLRVGMINLSSIYKFAGLGIRYQAVAFIKDPKASVEEFSIGIAGTIKNANNLLKAHNISPIITPGEYKYPLRGIQF